jgi:hypothetical protein
MFICPDFVAAFRNPELDANQAEQEDDNVMFDINEPGPKTKLGLGEYSL